MPSRPFFTLTSASIAVLLLSAAAVIALIASRQPHPKEENSLATSRLLDPAFRERRSETASRDARELAEPWIDTILRLEEARLRDAGPEPAVYMTIATSPERSSAFQTLLSGLSADNAAEAYQLLIAPGSPPLLDVEWSRFLEKWGRLDGPRAFDLLRASEHGRTKLPGLLGGWAATDPEAASLALTHLGEGGGEVVLGGHDLLTEGWHSCVLGWKGSDFDAIARTIADRSTGAAKDAATAALAARAVDHDPSAALVWALSIPDDGWRTEALERVGRRWMQMNPTAATVALEKAGCSAETIEALGLPPEPGFNVDEQPELLSNEGDPEFDVFFR